MNNPYSNLFDDEAAKKLPPADLDDPRFEQPNNVEPLDAILERIHSFQEKCEVFSNFLSNTRAIDHQEEAVSIQPLSALFYVLGNQSKGNLKAERDHYDLLQLKFREIIIRMQAIALEHWEVMKQFNSDIDRHYFSMTKKQRQVNYEIKSAVESINLQRRILSDAARDLQLLMDAMKANEKRLKKYIDAGGTNNLASSEHLVLINHRKQLTDGAEHQFNYHFFSMNFIDKMAIKYGVYLKETTEQYLQKLTILMDRT